MTVSAELTSAIAYARQHAQTCLKPRPFDPVYLITLEQLATVERALAERGDLSGLKSGEITLGLMAAKELGNDEADFAHALHIVQWDVDSATGDNKENRIS